MPIRAYLNLKGQTQGQIKGGVTQHGREGTIEIFDASYSVVGNHDPQTGLPTGKHRHKPVVLTAPTGRQSPLIFNASVDNENLTEFKLDFYLPNAQGVEKDAYRLELTNAHVLEFDLKFEGTAPGSTEVQLLDQYSFAFQKITLTWLSPVTSATDDWETPAS